MTQKTQYSVQIIVYFNKIMHFTDKTVCSNWQGSNVYISHIASLYHDISAYTFMWQNRQHYIYVIILFCNVQ